MLIKALLPSLCELWEIEKTCSCLTTHRERDGRIYGCDERSKWRKFSKNEKKKQCFWLDCNWMKCVQHVCRKLDCQATNRAAVKREGKWRQSPKSVSHCMLTYAFNSIAKTIKPDPKVKYWRWMWHFRSFSKCVLPSLRSLFAYKVSNKPITFER